MLGDASLDVLLAERAAYRPASTRPTLGPPQLTQLLAATAPRHGEPTLRPAPAAVEAEAAGAPAVAAERVGYEEARVLATVKGVEFPLVALDAYYRAARSIGADEPALPACSWWAVAGHLQGGGAPRHLRRRRPRRPAGTPAGGSSASSSTARNDTQVDRRTPTVVPSTATPTYDRAVGPMQFIPQTWTRFAADGNDDGVATPFNLYDATLAAARYLCRSSAGLDADPGLRAAYFSYNHSEAYVDRVLAFARLYERAIEVPEPPRLTHGHTSGRRFAAFRRMRPIRGVSKSSCGC